VAVFPEAFVFFAGLALRTALLLVFLVFLAFAGAFFAVAFFALVRVTAFFDAFAFFFLAAISRPFNALKPSGQRAA
jgi:hypothetical protein